MVENIRIIQDILLFGIDNAGTYIGTLLLIIVSSTAGATAIIIGRSLYQRRVFYAAVHSELYINYYTVKRIKYQIKQNPSENPMISFQGESASTSALESLRIHAPNLYIDLGFETENFNYAYDRVENLMEYKMVANENPQSVSVSFNSGQYVVGENPDLVREEIIIQLEGVREDLQKAIIELQEFRRENRTRRLLLKTSFTFDPAQGEEES